MDRSNYCQGRPVNWNSCPRPRLRRYCRQAATGRMRDLKEETLPKSVYSLKKTAAGLRTPKFGKLWLAFLLVAIRNEQAVTSKKRIRNVLAVVGCLCVAASVVAWIGWGVLVGTPSNDFEACSDAAASLISNQTDLRNSLAECAAKFAGRRKAGGGYHYLDLLQNRWFDIAGPNPTVHEQNYIDLEYVKYLAAQRREDLQSALMREQMKQADQKDASADSLATVGPPLEILPPHLRLKGASR